MATLSGAALQATAGNIPLPNAFRTVRFSDGTRRTVLESEIPLLDDCIKTGEPVRVDSSNQVFYVQTPTGGGNAFLDDALALRAAGMALAISGPDPTAPQPGTPPLGNVGEPLKFTFFIYDHLGNSRILYANKFEDCAPAGVRYLLEHVLDYYPYGKTLREYVHNRERFQTTGHERDAESGLDHRGARNYDGDVGRFLSVDPLAGYYAGWSSYHYVAGNPILLTDPTGMAWSKDNIKLATGWFSGSGPDNIDDYIYDEQEDGSWKRREGVEDDGGENFHTYKHKNGDISYYSSHDGHFVSIETAKINKRVKSLEATKVHQLGLVGAGGGPLGLTVSFGIAWDSKGNVNPYGSIGYFHGFDITGGIEYTQSRSKANGQNFSIYSLGGKGVSYNAGIYFFDGGFGSDTQGNGNYGQNKQATYNSYTGGVSLGIPIAASRSIEYTKIFKLLENP